MCDVCLVEIAPLIKGRISSRVEDVGGRSVIVRGPFHKVIRNIKCCRIWASVLEINNDYLDTTEELAKCGKIRPNEFCITSR